MNIHNIKNPLEKILHRLESLDPDQDIHPLDHNFFTAELQKAYNALYQIDSSRSSAEEEGEHPGKNTLFEFEAEQLAEKESKSEESEESSPKAEPAKPKPSPSVPPAPKKAPPSPPQATPEKKPATVESTEVKEKENSPTPKTASSEDSTTTDFSKDVQELFQIKESSELSERLSRLPITDIWSAMGLNERIFTQNELFDGDAESFQKTVKELNECQTFEEAQELLAYGPIENFDWAAAERRNIAKNFIRLVKRKYSK
jgi:chemotaxis protein histidine kinase CheA